MKKLCLASLLLLALGCATTGSASNTSASNTSASDADTATTQQTVSSPQTQRAPEEEKEQLVCVEETSIGSHIPKRVCRSKTKVKQDRDDARNVFETHQPGNTSFGQ